MLLADVIIAIKWFNSIRIFIFFLTEYPVNARCGSILAAKVYYK